jgi:hypothetical protein
MRGTFGYADLLKLEALYQQATFVLPVEDVYDGGTEPTDIAVRHDCDNVIAPAVDMATWECERNYVSTYYILHTSPYWQNKRVLRESLDIIAESGHNIGIHNDALTVALETGRDPNEILHEAVEELRRYGHEIRSTVAHGNQLCHVAKYVNDEMFEGCSRPDQGHPDRVLEHRGRRVPITPARGRNRLMRLRPGGLPPVSCTCWFIPTGGRPRSSRWPHDESVVLCSRPWTVQPHRHLPSPVAPHLRRAY